MGKAEETAIEAERARAAMGSLEIAASALQHAWRTLACAGQLDVTKANNEIGKLQMKLLARYEKLTGRKP